MNMKSVIRRGGMGILLAVVLAVPLASWGKGPINVTFFGSKALKGFDPVVNFTEGKPAKGAEAFTAEWMGANWYFVTAENRDLFKAHPEK